MNSLMHSPSAHTQPGSAEGSAHRWTAWAAERPTDTTAAYRWRVPARKVCGAVLRPEWTEKLTHVGMGYDDSEWWPLSPSHWNGYRRSVPAGLEWRPAVEGETEPTWEGLDLAPDPWTGLPPRINTKTRWIGAAIYEAEGFWLTHRFGSTGTWADVTKLAAAWNDRAASERDQGDRLRVPDHAIQAQAHSELEPDANPSERTDQEGRECREIGGRDALLASGPERGECPAGTEQPQEVKVGGAGEMLAPQAALPDASPPGMSEANAPNQPGETSRG